MHRAELDAAILAAHATTDRAALVGLYASAAEGSRDDEAGFFLTQAYVFALDCGDPRAPDLRAQLVGLGRETP